MVSILHFTENEIRRITIKELAQQLPSPAGVIWVDLEDPSEAEEETVLVSLLDLHPLAVEDCQRGREPEGHLPKVEDFGDYLLVIFNPIERTRGMEDAGPAMGISTTQLSAFLSKKILVTHHYNRLPAVVSAVQACAKNPQALGKGPDFLFHMIIDDIVNSYNPILDALDEDIDALEERVLQAPGQDVMFSILELKKNIMTVRRISAYQREMLSRLSRGEFPLITLDEMVYYRNVYDHLVRMSDLADSYRDVVTGLLDAYLSITSNRLSQVMKVLTIISTIFLPLSFITGFFGMNFQYLPGSDWEWGVPVAALGMAAVGFGMLWVFRRRGWM
ncbi:MAG: magnesium/cobalt transporter CorA [Bacteroidota bacterium]